MQYWRTFQSLSHLNNNMLYIRVIWMGKGLKGESTTSLPQDPLQGRRWAELECSFQNTLEKDFGGKLKELLSQGYKKFCSYSNKSANKNSVQTVATVETCDRDLPSVATTE